MHHFNYWKNPIGITIHSLIFLTNLISLPLLEYDRNSIPNDIVDSLGAIILPIGVSLVFMRPCVQIILTKMCQYFALLGLRNRYMYYTCIMEMANELIRKSEYFALLFQEWHISMFFPQESTQIYLSYSLFKTVLCSSQNLSLYPRHPLPTSRYKRCKNLSNSPSSNDIRVQSSIG